MVEWREVPGYSDYLISEYGFVVRKSDSEPKTISSAGGGYLVVRFGDRKTNYIHSLVLGAFVGPRPPGFVACHNDGNMFNNHFTNLRWDTQANNNKDKGAHATLRQISNKQLDSMFKMVYDGYEVNEVSRRFGVSRAWPQTAKKREDYKMPYFASNDYRFRDCRKIPVVPLTPSQIIIG